ncbi:bis(5'-nucleosidyl)-tetraphosphatase [Schizosaccharomyces cryophilus OY26]|uniref:Bis(5'-adenosyl)-triphosphatase n=1 Tax=Schizosaccharomyces cryophilus (strain OY26 / ATCC MYA-4695 / CBS 11777 / NBRC 106824 / NRRL Y48691) TaxID=653667 RepID=S9WZ31_SCHCR|nr:bis(5'-nucleosidyl)-tetraphosphatase [Schizosaccharomyces cryophilus OY26]EPY49957.1 bis(5'-nucleosidyl)-tetraphosphatase [Schizosaccharomyces cryophilus OY26]
MSKPFMFSAFNVTNQVFYQAKHSFAIVNLKPILPGHVLVIPRRVISDLFESVAKVETVLEKVYTASASNIGIQDGRDAGQTVPHLHVHLIPRKKLDFNENDEVYQHLEKAEANLASLQATGKETIIGDQSPPTSMKKSVPKDEDRHPRTPEVMQEEATWLRSFFQD